MSPITILARPTPVHDFLVSGPYPPHQNAFTPIFSDAAQFADGIIQTYLPQRSIVISSRPIWTHVSAGAGGNIAQRLFKGIQAREMKTIGGGRVNQGLEGISMMPNTAGTFGPGYINPSWRRVQRFMWTLALQAGSVPDEQSGVLFVLLASGAFLSTDNWPLAPSVQFGGGFGITGNSSGSWQWQSFDGTAPPNPVTETVDLAAFINDPEAWNTFELQIISASGGRAAVCELYVNDVLAISRNWVDNPAPNGLVDYGLAAAIENYKFVPIVQVAVSDGGGINSVFMGDWTFSMGRFLRDGREITT